MERNSKSINKKKKKKVIVITKFKATPTYPGYHNIPGLFLQWEALVSGEKRHQKLKGWPAAK